MCFKLFSCGFGWVCIKNWDYHEVGCAFFWMALNCFRVGFIELNEMGE